MDEPEPHPAATRSFLSCVGLRDTSAEGRDNAELFLSDVKQGWQGLCALLLLIPTWDGHRMYFNSATWESEAEDSGVPSCGFSPPCLEGSLSWGSGEQKTKSHPLFIVTSEMGPGVTCESHLKSTPWQAPHLLH